MSCSRVIGRMVGSHGIPASHSTEVLHQTNLEKKVETSYSKTVLNDKPPTTLLVLGGTSQMGLPIIKKALTEGYSVLACSRGVPKEAKGGVQWLQVKEDQLGQVKFWKETFSKNIPEGNEVVLINTIGAAVAPKGQTLEDVNAKPIMAATQALMQDENHSRKAIGHFSTIAASFYPSDPEKQKMFCKQAKAYCRGRQEVDEFLRKSGLPVTIVRPGYMFSDPNASKTLVTKHPYSPEQFANMSFHPVLGSGKQIQQPVYVGDVIDAVMNGVKKDEVNVVDAVGPDTMTQEEMFKFFTDLSGQPFKPVYIPYELGQVIANYFPKGRLAPYSVGMFKHLENEGKEPLCKKKFEALVGKPLTSMQDLYQNLGSETLAFSKPPIAEHVKEILKGIACSPTALAVLSYAVIKYGPGLFLQAVRQYLAS